MKRYNVFYFIGQAISGLWRNGIMSVASIAVLMSLLVVIGGFSLLVKNINVNLEQFAQMNEIAVFLEPDAEEEDIVAIGEKIARLDNVADVRRITKSEALADMKEKSDIYADVTEEDNPLMDSFIITFSETSEVPELDYQLKQIEGIKKINNRLDLANTIEKFKSGVMLIFIWFLAILAVVSVFIIINTIKLSVFARRQEISIMRYVGATGWFISLPFMIEGIIIGLIASIAAYFIEWYIYTYIESMVIEELQMLTIVPFASINHIVLIGFIALGIVTGIIGSCISLGKYLKS